MFKRLRRWLFRLKWEVAPGGSHVARCAFAEIIVMPTKGGRYTWLAFERRFLGQMIDQSEYAWPSRQTAMRVAELWVFAVLERKHEDRMRHINTWGSRL